MKLQIQTKDTRPGVEDAWGGPSISIPPRTACRQETRHDRRHWPLFLFVERQKTYGDTVKHSSRISYDYSINWSSSSMPQWTEASICDELARGGLPLVPGKLHARPL